MVYLQTKRFVANDSALQTICVAEYSFAISNKLDDGLAGVYFINKKY
jgi:hypothetical protein